MARTLSKEMTPQIFTLWHRSPEVLCGAPDYLQAVEIWSLVVFLVKLLQENLYLKLKQKLKV